MIRRWIIGVGVAAVVAGGAHAVPDVDQINPSVVRVVTLNDDGKVTGGGSGFVISEAGYAITNDHVIADDDGNPAARVVVLPHGAGLDQGLSATVVRRSPAQDLAVLELRGGQLPPLTIATKLPKQGDEVYAVGFPNISDYHGVTQSTTLSNGSVMRVAPKPTDSGSLLQIQHQAQLFPGNSGAPLLDACGRVVGVNSSTLGQRDLGNVYFAIASSELTSMLQRTLPGTDARVVTSVCYGASVLNDPKLIAAVVLGVALFALIAFFVLRKRHAAPAATLTGATGGDGTPPPLPPMPAPAQPTRPRSATGVLLAGFDAGGNRVSLEIDDDALAQGAIIGRSRANSDIVIADSRVSRRHTLLIGNSENLQVEDLGSKNGTWVNGRPLVPGERLPLRVNDTLKVGPFELLVSRK